LIGLSLNQTTQVLFSDLIALSGEFVIAFKPPYTPIGQMEKGQSALKQTTFYRIASFDQV